MTRIRFLLVAMPGLLFAQTPGTSTLRGWGDDPPALSSLVAFAHTESDLRVAVTRYTAGFLPHSSEGYPVAYSPARAARLLKFQEGWQRRLGELDFASLNFEGQIDYLALRKRIEYEIEKLRLQQERSAQMAGLLPFQDAIRQLEEDRLDRKRVDGRVGRRDARQDRDRRRARQPTPLPQKRSAPAES